MLQFVVKLLRIQVNPIFIGLLAKVNIQRDYGDFQLFDHLRW
jgi:hypothetical protein